MATFTGEITKLATVKPSCRVGEYPELLVDFIIRGHGLSFWEQEWHAYLVVMDLQGKEIASRFREDFNQPFGWGWPDPDIRQVTKVQIPLYSPQVEGGLPIVVQLYGSTTSLVPEGFIQQKELTIPMPAPIPVIPAPSEVKWKTLLAIGGGIGLALILLGNVGREK